MPCSGLPSRSGMKSEFQTQGRGPVLHPVGGIVQRTLAQTRRPRCWANFLSHQRAPANPTADPDTHTLVKTDDSHWLSLQPGQEMAHCHRRPLHSGGLIPRGRVGLSPGVWTFQRLLRRVAVHAAWVPPTAPGPAWAWPPCSSLTSLPSVPGSSRRPACPRWPVFPPSGCRAVSAAC